MNIEEQRDRLRAELSRLEEEKQESVGLRTLPLDAEDKLRIENIVLREQIMKRDMEEAKKSLHIILIAKYKVDASKEEVSVDAQAGTITITPLSV